MLCYVVGMIGRSPRLFGLGKYVRDNDGKFILDRRTKQVKAEAEASGMVNVRCPTYCPSSVRPFKVN